MTIVPTVALQSLNTIPVSSGSVNINVQWQITAPVDSRTLQTLASGANTIAVPTGATICIITPPTTNTNTLTLKGVTGDTGVLISKVTPTVISLGVNATFCLTASGSTPLVEIMFL